MDEIIASRASLAFVLVSGGLGGGQRVALSVAAGVQGKVPLVVISPNDGPTVSRFRALGAHVELIKDVHFYDARLFLLLRRVMRERHVRCVYTHASPVHEFIIGGAGRSAGSHLVLHRHSLGALTSARLAGGVQRIAWRWILQQADEIICVSPQVEAQVLEIAGRSDSHLIYNGVPEMPSSPAPSNDPVKVAFVGRIDPNKRPEDFLRAVALVTASGHGAEFVLVGGGLGDAYEARFMRLLGELDLQEKIHRTGDVSDARAVIEDIDVLVLPSSLEGHPLVLLEAMSARKAVVVSDIPGHRETVQDGIDGLVVPLGDVSALATAIEILIDDPSLRERLGSAAAERVRDRFLEERMTEDILQVLNPLL